MCLKALKAYVVALEACLVVSKDYLMAYLVAPEACLVAPKSCLVVF